MEVRRQGGSNFLEVDAFNDVYVRPGDELDKSLHVNGDDGQKAVGSSGVCLPASSQDFARVYGSPRGCRVSDPYRDLGSNSWAKAGDVL
ncbi:hypothetical protein D8674_041349 [Pyrus ussuriensis x Pyrus communis]|uniref:Uncharacterized protein n=1 Tax=Pyrus ussuriensis x Pyrus communis TaxID=2448454 RepID=A0A5N5GLC7_9ROSA|nr:hypothetical protein D8674_041349 [Pyrus ussuriensis x Pyrus communis]